MCTKRNFCRNCFGVLIDYGNHIRRKLRKLKLLNKTLRIFIDGNGNCVGLLRSILGRYSIGYRLCKILRSTTCRKHGR
ncbi:hypothetical protein [Alistipes sp. ZOR0009]|uniref:hypothetical protein n=1 Tax=Alistipes sp. ZOR0009 TaxID=1339253 RepID=UPI0039772DBB